MKASFLLLVLADLLLMVLTILMGWQVRGTEGFLRHVLLGILTGLFTCFVHVVLLTYFIVQDKIMKQSMTFDGLDAAYVSQTITIKSRAVRLAIAGIGAILIVTALGAAIEAKINPQIHMIAAFCCLVVQGWVFFQQYSTLDEYGRLFDRAFGEQKSGSV